MSRKSKKVLDKIKNMCIIKSVTITDFERKRKMKNYSRQREAILNVLRSTNSHPTAAWIYEQVREKIPNISLGTVYRNLAALSESGDILSISVGDGQEHYDGDNSAHIHLHCKTCGSIADLNLAHDPLAAMAAEQGFQPETSVYLVYGACENCKNFKN